MEGLVAARVVEQKQGVAFYQGGADAVGQQRVDQILRQLAHAAVEKLDQLMTGVKAVEALVFQQHLSDLGVAKMCCTMQCGAAVTGLCIHLREALVFQQHPGDLGVAKICCTMQCGAAIPGLCVHLREAIVFQ